MNVTTHSEYTNRARSAINLSRRITACACQLSRVSTSATKTLASMTTLVSVIQRLGISHRVTTQCDHAGQVDQRIRRGLADGQGRIYRLGRGGDLLAQEARKIQ